LVYYDLPAWSLVEGLLLLRPLFMKLCIYSRIKRLLGWVGFSWGAGVGHQKRKVAGMRLGHDNGFDVTRKLDGT
jgi:hypothetical protein